MHAIWGERDENMKILYFMNHAGTGGAALALYDLIHEIMDEPNINIVVVTGRHNELNAMLDNLGIENYSAPFKNFMSTNKKPEWFWKIILKIRYIINKPIAIRKIEKMIDFQTVDIIHSNLNRIDIGAYFSKKYNIPHIWHLREHAEGDFHLLSIYKDYIGHMESYPSTYIAISNSVKEIWENRGLPAEKIKLIYDGVKSNGWNSKIERSKGSLKVLFMGGYNGNKGQEMLLEALTKVPKNIVNDMQVDFYGGGLNERKSFFDKIVIENNLQKVVSLNAYDNNIYAKIPEYDIGINCSKAEGFGRVTVEYMMAGLCPIVSDTGANIELISDCETGLIYHYGDANDLAEKLIYLYSHRTQCTVLGNKAKKYAKDSFSMQRHAQFVINLYDSIMRG